MFLLWLALLAQLLKAVKDFQSGHRAIEACCIKLSPSSLQVPERSIDSSPALSAMLSPQATVLDLCLNWRSWFMLTGCAVLLMVASQKRPGPGHTAGDVYSTTTWRGGGPAVSQKFRSGKSFHKVDAFINAPSQRRVRLAAARTGCQYPRPRGRCPNCITAMPFLAFQAAADRLIDIDRQQCWQLLHALLH